MRRGMRWGALLALLLSACGGTAVSQEPPARARLANPADVKCAADGWRTEPILTHGVPTGTICVEPDSGRRCEAWAYFRGECPAAERSPPGIPEPVRGH